MSSFLRIQVVDPGRRKACRPRAVFGSLLRCAVTVEKLDLLGIERRLLQILLANTANADSAGHGNSAPRPEHFSERGPAAFTPFSVLGRKAHVERQHPAGTGRRFEVEP